MKYHQYLIAATAVGLLSVACTNDGYDTGDGNLSYIKAEFVLLATNADGTVDKATTDDSATLQMENPFKQTWAERPDTVYRALLYYDTTDNGAPVKARSVRQVPVVGLVDSERVKDFNDSPLGVESVWMAHNASFANLSLLLKTGKADQDDMRQTIALVADSVYTDTDGKRHLALRLLHDQGNVPQYYTTTQYVSIGRATFDGADSLDIRLNTYEGVVVRHLSTSPQQ